MVSEILSSWAENHGMAIFNNQPQIKLPAIKSNFGSFANATFKSNETLP